MKLKNIVLLLLCLLATVGSKENSKMKSFRRAMKLILRQCKREANFRLCNQFTRRVNQIKNINLELVGNDPSTDEINEKYVKMLFNNRTLIQRFIKNLNDPDLLGVLMQDDFPNKNRTPTKFELDHIANLTSNSTLLKKFIVIFLNRVIKFFKIILI